MYRLINKHRDAVLDTIESRADMNRYVALRAQLISTDIDVRTDIAFQKAYRNHWGMNRRGDAFCRRYFRLLASCAKSHKADVGAVVRDLAKENGALEFSFATKLAHMIDPHVPVYDSLVAAFYFYPRPSDKSFDARLRRYLAFHEFLICEYQRVLAQDLLAPTLKQFRKRFKVASTICDERMLDWVVWASVLTLQRQAQIVKPVLYE
jgi:hypothetical protein